MSSVKNFAVNFAHKIYSFFPCCCSPEEDLPPSAIISTPAGVGVSKIQECFLRNMEAIMQSRGGDVFTSREGLLVFSAENLTSPLERQEGLELIKQVLRQAWGKVVEAQCAIGIGASGPVLLEEAIHRVDLLQDKLRQILPVESVQKVLADEKWAKILANNYKASTSELIEKISQIQSVDARDPQIQKIQIKLQAREKVLQEYRENKKAEYNFISFTKDSGGLNFSGTKSVKKGSETCVISKKGKEDVNWETSDLAWLNEMIGATFDQICGCRFGTAASTLALDENLELNTLHSFKKSDSDRWHQAFDVDVDLKSSHQFVLFNILLKTQDSHKGNILCRYENGKYIPIPIDLGRMLSPAPHRSLESLLRFTAFINWDTLDQEFDLETKKFVESLDPNKIVDAMRRLFINHPSLKQASQLEILERKLTHLRANILMVKEAVKENLTPKQLIALSIFRLSHANIKEIDTIQKDPKNSGHHDRSVRKYLLRHCYCAFLSAWNTARVEGTFNEEKFVRKIRQSILNIKGINVSERYFYKAAMTKFDELYL